MSNRLVLLGALLVAISAQAHTRSQSHSVWEINGQSVDLLMTIPTVDEERLYPGQLSRSEGSVETYLADRIYPIGDGKRCALIPPITTPSAAVGYRKFDFTFKCESNARLQLHFAAFFEDIISHVNFAQVQNEATAEFTEQLFTNEHRTIEVTGDNGGHLKNARFLEFVKMGLLHIFTGVDHMSFLLGLVLISRRLRDLVSVITGFTLGHSLTLALAVTGVLRPHAEYIDALVALTIALIGAENTVVQTRRSAIVSLSLGGIIAAMALAAMCGAGNLPALLLCGASLFTASYLGLSGKLNDAGRLRILITVVFGLIHGFGFASDLLEMQLPSNRLAELLIGFNVGVELGQLTLVIGTTLLVTACRKAKWTLPRPMVVNTASAFLVGLGLFWLVTRNYA